MICTALQSIDIPARALLHGSRMHDMERCPDGSTYQELSVFHAGKDESINQMLSGGNGFPSSGNFGWATVTRIAFDAGCTIERRDLRSLTAWSRDLNQCIADRKRGRVA